MYLKLTHGINLVRQTWLHDLIKTGPDDTQSRKITAQGNRNGFAQTI